MDTQRSLIADIESAITGGSADQRIQILRRVTDLFVSNAASYSEAHLEVFDDVISRLAKQIETKARAELACRLAPIPNAPITTVRRLARDQAISVSAPVLSQSKRLTDVDLLACCESSDQARLLAVSKRASLSEAVGDMLATRGNRDVVLSAARNAGARFSDVGFGKLVERSVNDDELTMSVGLRPDIPKEHLQSLVNKASEIAFNKLAAHNPAALSEVTRVVFDLTGHKVQVSETNARNYVRANAAFDELQRSGQSVEAAVQDYASTGKLEETIVVFARLCQVPIAAVERIFSDHRVDSDMVLLLIKAADMTWPTAKLILDLRCGDAGLSPQAATVARQHFERLQPATAKRVVRFYQARNGAREVPKVVS